MVLLIELAMLQRSAGGVIPLSTHSNLRKATFKYWATRKRRVVGNDYIDLIYLKWERKVEST